jgi:hypothetical protein
MRSTKMSASCPPSRYLCYKIRVARFSPGNYTCVWNSKRALDILSTWKVELRVSENNTTARKCRDDRTSERVRQEPQLRVSTRNEGTMSSRGNDGKKGSCTLTEYKLEIDSDSQGLVRRDESRASSPKEREGVL